MTFQTKILVATLALFAASASAPTTSNAQCRAADSDGSEMLSKYKSNLRRSAGDFSMQQWLIRHSIPRVDPNTVVLVSDKNVCAKAVKAYNTAVGNNGTAPSGSVYVVKIGTVYVVKDPVQVSSGWDLEVVLDSQFKIKSKMLA